jgi:hypothetical protein
VDVVPAGVAVAVPGASVAVGVSGGDVTVGVPAGGSGGAVGEAVGVGDPGVVASPPSAEQPAVTASTASITAAATRQRAGVGCGAVMASGK